MAFTVCMAFTSRIRSIIISTLCSSSSGDDLSLRAILCSTFWYRYGIPSNKIWSISAFGLTLLSVRRSHSEYTWHSTDGTITMVSVTIPYWNSLRIMYEKTSRKSIRTTSNKHMNEWLVKKLPNYRRFPMNNSRRYDMIVWFVLSLLYIYQQMFRPRILMRWTT